MKPKYISFDAAFEKQFDKYKKRLTESDIRYGLSGQCSQFISDLGVDDEVLSSGSVVFQVYGDGVKLYDSGLMRGSSATKQVNVEISGRNTLQLVVTDGGDGIGNDHADWADARVVCSTGPS